MLVYVRLNVRERTNQTGPLNNQKILDPIKINYRSEPNQKDVK
jgi:hypothetical protein